MEEEKKGEELMIPRKNLKSKMIDLNNPRLQKIPCTFVQLDNSVQIQQDVQSA